MRLGENEAQRVVFYNSILSAVRSPHVVIRTMGSLYVEEGDMVSWSFIKNAFVVHMVKP